MRLPVQAKPIARSLLFSVKREVNTVNAQACKETDRNCCFRDHFCETFMNNQDFHNCRGGSYKAGPTGHCMRIG